MPGDVLPAMVDTSAADSFQDDKPVAPAEPGHVCCPVPRQLPLGTQALLDLPHSLRGDPRHSDRPKH